MHQLKALPISSLYNAVQPTKSVCNEETEIKNRNYNHKWQGISFEKWVSSLDHPIPVISLLPGSHVLRYVNSQQLSLQEGKLIRRLPMTLHTPLYYIKRKNPSWILFRQNVDLLVTNHKSEILVSQFRRGTLQNIIQTTDNVADYCVCYRFETGVTVCAIVRVMHIHTRSGKHRTNKQIGRKVTMEILLEGLIASAMWLYTVSYSVAQHLMIAGYAVGNQAYCYKYIARFWKSSFKHFVYFDYDPLKKVKSIVKYYESVKCIVTAQRNVCPSNCVIDNNLSLNVSHKWWTGLILQANVITTEYKLQLYSKIINMLHSHKYGHIEYSINRVKISFLYYYLYKDKYANEKELHIAQGLRVCENQFVPIWLKDLVMHCKRKLFIHGNHIINQISINVYYHQIQDKPKQIAFASIGSHNNEQLKFKNVYSLTLYSEGFGANSYLSYNLTQNCTNGELRLPLPDCVGLEMCEGSWCLSNGTSHSVSKCELQILPEQWRIVFLFRVAHTHIWRQAKQLFLDSKKVKN